MHPAVRGCKCCPDDTPCRCGCPCGTGGGIVSCDGRVHHPIDGELSFTDTSSSIEYYYGPGRVYRNLTDIAAWIAETDINAVADGRSSVLFKFRSEWSWTGSSYTITDNTSMGCNTVHRGVRTHLRALNGDTYTFDAMGGMPRLENTFSVLSTTRRSGTDVTGVDDDGHSYENNFWKDPDVQTDDAACGYWTTQASADSSGAVSFLSTFTPAGLAVPGTTVIGPHSSSQIRWKYKTVFKDFTSDSGTITNIVKGLPPPSIGPLSVTSVGSIFGSGGSMFEGIGTAPSTTPPPHVCQGDVALSFEDANHDDYDFDIDARSDAPGSYTSEIATPYFTAATYVTEEPAGFRANFATDISTTATVGTRSNPGGQNCSRCYTVEFTETDGDTAAVTTIFSGEVFQDTAARVPPGVDPRTLEGWVTSTSWRSRSVTPLIQIYRAGPELWIAEVSNGSGTQIFNLKGVDCLEDVTEVESAVTEVRFWATTGSGTVSDPTIRGGSTRLKIDTRSFTATPSTCTECLDDPCEEPCPSEIELWDTGEEDGGDPDFDDTHWEVENANGSGVFVPAIVLVTDAAWVASSSPAEWIGIERHDPYGGEPWSGSRIFRTYINSIGAPPAVDITGLLACDNEVTSISVNGVIVETSIGTYTSKTAFTLPASEMIEGSNEILFEVADDGAVAGLLVEWD